jgi:hypothetical protein
MSDRLTVRNPVPEKPPPKAAKLFSITELVTVVCPLASV